MDALLTGVDDCLCLNCQSLFFPLSKQEEIPHTLLLLGALHTGT